MALIVGAETSLTPSSLNASVAYNHAAALASRRCRPAGRVSIFPDLTPTMDWTLALWRVFLNNLNRGRRYIGIDAPLLLNVLNIPRNPSVEAKPVGGICLGECSNCSNVQNSLVAEHPIAHHTSAVFHRGFTSQSRRGRPPRRACSHATVPLCVLQRPHAGARSPVKMQSRRFDTAPAR